MFSILKFLLCLFVLLSPFAVYGQQEQGERCRSRSTADTHSIESEGWVSVKTPAFDFCLPKTLEAKPASCYEGNCFRFESEDFLLKIDLDAAAWKPNIQKQYPTYYESFSKIGGRPSWIWGFEDGGEYKYISGINFQRARDNKFGMGIYLFSKFVPTSELADKIFKSVRFNKKYRH